MKKILLLISFLVVSLSAIHAAEGQLNAYAYGAQFAYDPNTQTIAFNWSLPSEASALRIVAVDAEGKKYVLKEYGTTPSMAYSSVMSIWDAVDELPLNEDLSLAIEVKTAGRTKHEVIASKEYTMQSPFSIDIDNNLYSKYFGLKYVTQMDGSSSLPRGVYIFDQTNIKAKDAQLGAGITLPNSWWAGTHGIPHMVRVIPDGSGRLLISTSDQSQDTYLWLAEPSGDASVPTYPTWKTVITNDQLVGWTGYSGRFANASFDIRSNGDNWDIILYTADAKNGTEFWASNIYTGVYSVPKSSSDLTGGTYTPYTVESGGIINQHYTRSMLNASVNFDEYGGVLYNAHSDDTDASSPTFKHRTLNGDFKDDYVDGNYLSRTFVPKGVRFSPDFKKLAVAQNAKKDANGTELRIYDVTQTDGNSHPIFSNGISVDVITGSSEKAFVHDIAWDHGKNVYITVRNQTTKVDGEYIHGIYAVALDLNGEVISTPLQDPNKNKYFRIDCLDGNYTISLQQEGGTGTLTGAGTYASCTAVTVTAVPDNQYKFIRWKENGNEVSTNPTYTFYASKDRTLTAEFEPAVYNNITWWNLFENGEDITTIGRDANDDKLNNRLWYLFMPMFNEYAPKTSRADNGKAGSYNEFNVMGFTSTDYDNKVKDFMENANSPFYWLGCYILNEANKTSMTNTQWRYHLYSFFNRTDTPRNSAGSAAYGTTVSFKEKGHPNYWRSWWTNIACSNSKELGKVLPKIMTYNDPMPTDWNKISAPSSSVTHDPKSWYKWNQVDSEQNGGNSDTHILAWRKDGVKGPIITRVEEDNLRLYATYVKKHIQEDDPTPDMSGDYPQDATNSDVFRLLFNKTWDPNYAHKLTITRKIQGGMYNTVCFPFKVYLGQDGSIPYGNQFKDATFWAYTGTSSKYNESGDPVTILEFQQVTDTLGAGIPYLVWSDNDIIDEVLFGNADSQSGHTHVLCDTVPKLVAAKAGSPIPISFVGVINPEKNLPAQSLILVANNRLASTTEPGRMEGLRGYFTIDPMWAAEIAEQAADGRVYLSMKKPVTTSIPVAPEAEQQTKPQVRKILHNGQIYILRGNEVYDLNGRLLRKQ